jgi:hypothetical protein
MRPQAGFPCPTPNLDGDIAMFTTAESLSQPELSRRAAERYAQLSAVAERKAQAKLKKLGRVRSAVTKAA